MFLGLDTQAINAVKQARIEISEAVVHGVRIIRPFGIVEQLVRFVQAMHEATRFVQPIRPIKYYCNDTNVRFVSLEKVQNGREMETELSVVLEV